MASRAATGNRGHHFTRWPKAAHVQYRLVKRTLLCRELGHCPEREGWSGPVIVVMRKVRLVGWPLGVLARADEGLSLEVKKREQTQDTRGGRCGQTRWFLCPVRDMICTVQSVQVRDLVLGSNWAFTRDFFFFLTHDFKLNAYLPQARGKVHLLPEQ